MALKRFVLFPFFLLLPLLSQAQHESSFVAGGGVGFGLANNPVISSDGNFLSGFTYAATLGYRISEKFTIDFGPSLWIEAGDMFNNDVPAGERPKNKRMTVAFSGYFYPSNSSLAFRLGAGIGTMVYSPKQNSIFTEARYIDPTEILTGLAGMAGLSYEWRIGNRVLLYPSVGFTYTTLRNPEIGYNSAIDASKGSMVTDIKCNLYFDF